jgi:DNA repair exonuclease SbcCD ATPase subunit
MLKKLTLKKFGKFNHKTLDFNPVTIVSGLNEAGKTTVFDALFDALCSPPGNIREGKELKRRYGEDRQMDVEFEGEKIHFEVSEFMNLYALRAGDINIELDDRSAWMEKVKSHLFSGGIDPNLIRANLEKRASTKGSMTHNRELNRLKSERDQAEKQLSILKEKRDLILGDEKQVASLKQHIQKMEQIYREKEMELEKLKQQLDLEEKIRSRKKMDGYLEFLDQGVKFEREIKSLSVFQNDQTEELDRLQKGIIELNSDYRLIGSSIKNSQDSVEKMEREKRELVKKKEKTRVLSELATSMNEKIKSFLANLPTTSRTSWNKPLLSLGIIALIIGIILAALTEGNVFRIILASAGILLLAFLGLMAKKTKVTVDERERQNFFGKLIDEWKNSAFDDDRGQWQTLEGFQEILLSKRTAYSDLEAKIIKVDEELNKALEKLENDQKSHKQLREKLEEFMVREKQWLKARNVANRDEYVGNVIKHRDLMERFKQWQEELSSILGEKNLENPEDLRRLCDRTLREFDEEGIPVEGRPENEIVLLKRAVDEKSREIESTSSELHKYREELKEKGGVIRGSLGELPVLIIKEEARIQKYDREIENNLLEREAAELASDIFSSVAQDSEAALGELSKSLSYEFGEIVGGSRQVNVSHLDTPSISMTDAGGVERPLEDLSSGTRNSFLFAARLALAKRAAVGKSLLILDEPFTSFDKVRLGNALAVLKKFHDESDWQVIFLTKDEFLVDQVKEVFTKEKVKEHRLTL